MRSWQLDHKTPTSLIIAADARFSQTNYADDQSWELLLGRGEDSALALQTQYGGRAGLVSLVPFWEFDGRNIAIAQAYHAPPVVTAFAPGYLHATSELLADVHVDAEYWVAASQAVTGRFTVRNASPALITLRFDLFAHVIAEGAEQQINVLTLQDQTNALYLGKLGNIDPVVVVEDGAAALDMAGRVRARVGRQLKVEAGAQATVRWAHAALPEMLNSTRQARYWLGIPWEQVSEQVDTAVQSLPQIEMGDDSLDATIAFGYHHAVQAFLRPTSFIPHASFVAAREPRNGYSASRIGVDREREWGGQPTLAAYLLTDAVASIDPVLAEGVLRNYAALQAEDGTIDGQRGGLSMPLLAQMTLRVYRATRNDDFVRDMLPSLAKFFRRWFREDMDVDGDGVPEWRRTPQTGYAGWPLFNGGVDISTVETPDMVAYLLLEADALRELATTASDLTLLEELTPRVDELEAALSDFWQDGAFVYRDRDTHSTPSGAVLLEKASADQEHLLASKLADPSRLVIEVVGGASHKPQMMLTLSGKDSEGAEVSEQLAADAFTWGYGRGTATTQHVYALIDRIEAQGLSRVYRLNVRSIDLAVIDMNTVLPLITGRLSTEQTALVVGQIREHLLRPNGLALFEAAPGEDESGIWVFWNALLCDALLRLGEAELAVQVLRRLLNVQAAALREVGRFTPFYRELVAQGIGTRLDIGGMPPLGTLMRALGVEIQADGTVNIQQGFAWDTSVTVRQHGIAIQRDREQTRVTLPDGTVHTVPAGEAASIAPTETTLPLTPMDLPEKPSLVTNTEPSVTPISIHVEIIEDDI